MSRTNQYEAPCAHCDVLLPAGTGRLDRGEHGWEVTCRDRIGCWARATGRPRAEIAAELDLVEAPPPLPGSQRETGAGPYGTRR